MNLTVCLISPVLFNLVTLYPKMNKASWKFSDSSELLNIQDVQELELASANVEALVDTLNSLDIQESKYASSDVEKLVRLNR